MEDLDDLEDFGDLEDLDGDFPVCLVFFMGEDISITSSSSESRSEVSFDPRIDSWPLWEKSFLFL